MSHCHSLPCLELLVSNCFFLNKMKSWSTCYFGTGFYMPLPGSPWTALILRVQTKLSSPSIFCLPVFMLHIPLHTRTWSAYSFLSLETSISHLFLFFAVLQNALLIKSRLTYFSDKANPSFYDCILLLRYTWQNYKFISAWRLSD